MDEMTQQNSGLAEQSASSARELATEAERLSQLMSFFRVGAAAPTAAGNSGTEAVADSSWKAVEKSAGDQPAPLKASGGDWEDF
jgi:methyl-accepting chemotaxis protein